MPAKSFKIGGAMKSLNTQFKELNNLLKDPENMLIALLLFILLVLVVYYYRLNNENYENYENY